MTKVTPAQARGAPPAVVAAFEIPSIQHLIKRTLPNNARRPKLTTGNLRSARANEFWRVASDCPKIAGVLSRLSTDSGLTTMASVH
jgi:hypothetical protein